MENELIYRKTAKEMFLHAPMTEDEKIMIFRRLNAVPAVDAVERAVYEQVVWERDLAVKQLADIGKSLGEKMDDVAKLVRCRECRLHGICSTEDVFRFADLSEENRYCGAGKRRGG